MLFIIEKLLWLLVDPSTILLILAWFGIILFIRRYRAAGMICLTASLSIFTLIAILPIGSWLQAPLENRFPEIKSLPANITGIIVLGGAVETDISAARGIPSLDDAAERMTALVYLASQYPTAKLAFTGGNGGLIHSSMTEADVARELFTELGVDQSRMVYVDSSRTTYENAVLLKAQLNPQPEQLWLLVTSAAHMPRAVGLFRHAGWSVLPYPVGYKTAPGLLSAINASFPLQLAMVDLATHEWIGLAAYFLLGHTSALFPAPQPPAAGA